MQFSTLLQVMYNTCRKSGFISNQVNKGDFTAFYRLSEKISAINSLFSSRNICKISAQRVLTRVLMHIKGKYGYQPNTASYVTTKP